MKGPGDEVRFLLTLLLTLWLLSYGYSMFALPDLEEARLALAGDRDLSTVSHFLGWQGIAGGLAFAVFGVSRLWPQGAAARQLGNLPILLALLLIAVMAAMIFAENAANVG
ncbi:MAG: hypothetical protein AAF222_01770 [Pseudomonadota bacterium]